MSYGAIQNASGDAATFDPEFTQMDAKMEDSFRRIFRLRDLPALLIPWLFFAIALVPCLLQDLFLSYIAIGVCVLMSLGFILLTNGRAWQMLAVICLTLSLLGAYAGYYDRGKYMGEYFVYKNSPSYENVLPSANPGALKDSVFLTFSRDAHVDPTRGVGYQDGQQWCAAPIVGSAHLDSVGFWAVGTDCCRPRGSFRCGDIWNRSKHSGLVVIDASRLAAPEVPMYTMAVRMASLTYGLALPDAPTLIRWDVSTEEVLHDIMGSAVLFAALALLIALLIIPCFIVLLNIFELPLNYSHPDAVREMVFGISFTPQDYSPQLQQLQRDLMKRRCYWSGEVIYDYAFHVANRHLFIGCLLSHPAHPYSKLERTITLAIVAVLIMFPVAALSVAFGQASLLRNLLVVLGITIPRNVLKDYMIYLAQEASQLELHEGRTVGRALKVQQALTYEYTFILVCIVLTASVCALCSLWIKSHTDQPLGKVLLMNCDGLGFAFILEFFFDLLTPFFGRTVHLGFFGRWYMERGDFQIEDQKLQEPKPVEIPTLQGSGSAAALLVRR